MLHPFFFVSRPTSFHKDIFPSFLTANKHLPSKMTDKFPSCTTITDKRPSSPTPQDKRSTLFNLPEPMAIATAEFQVNWWPLADNFWTQTQKYTRGNGDIVHEYACRLSKPYTSSSRVEGVPLQKRRVTTTRPPVECDIVIRVTEMKQTMITLVEHYKGASTHSHSIEDVDLVKLPSAIVNLVSQEAKKPYKPPSIVVAVTELARDQGLGEVVDKLTRDKVANVQRSLRSSENALLAGADDLQTDLNEAVAHLQSKQYAYCQFSAQRPNSQHSSSSSTVNRNEMSYGLFFAHHKHLESLTNHGWLTLMDSTHGTNKHDWKLFTLYIRDKFNCWNIGGHFFVSHENIPIITVALKTVREYAPHWEPRYVLTDDSATEVASILKAFPGTEVGEQNCDPIRCTVHTMRTWMRKICVTAARNKMIQAMHKTTKIGCENMIKEALEAAKGVKESTDTINRYSDKSREWALWSRQHSPLLLQVTTTNPLESYHGELKRLSAKTHSIFGRACI